VAVVDVNGKLTGNRLYVACTRALHQLALYHV
jgi:DNA helicase IV